MSRFSSPTLAGRTDDRIQELEDGFVLLGDEDIPFTLQGGESVTQARQVVRRDGELRDAFDRHPIKTDRIEIHAHEIALVGENP